LTNSQGEWVSSPNSRTPTGRVRHTDPKVSRALLDAMGLAVEDADHAKAMLLELERGEAERRFRP
jgi:hypothetical protein